MPSSQSWPIRQLISTATPSSSASTKTTFPRYVKLHADLKTAERWAHSAMFSLRWGHIVCRLTPGVSECLSCLVCVNLGRKRKHALDKWYSGCGTVRMTTSFCSHWSVSILFDGKLLNCIFTCFHCVWFLIIYSWASEVLPVWHGPNHTLIYSLHTLCTDTTFFLPVWH